MSELWVVFLPQGTHDQVLNPLASEIDVAYKLLNAFEFVVGEAHGGAQDDLAQHGKNEPIVLKPDFYLIVGVLDQVEVTGRELGPVNDLIDQQPDALIGHIFTLRDKFYQIVQNVQETALDFLKLGWACYLVLALLAQVAVAILYYFLDLRLVLVSHFFLLV